MTHKVTVCGLDTTNLPKMKSGEIGELLKKVKAGDKEAEDYFILANMRLVLSMVQRFKNKCGNSDDLFQVGCVGLLKAVKYFDPAYNVKFSTYAVPMISGEIRRFLRDETSIKVPRSMRDIAYKALKAKEEYEKKNERIPSVMEIAAEIDQSVFEVNRALDAVSEPLSIYDTSFSDGDDVVTLFEQLSDNKECEAAWIENVTLNDAIKSLTKREREVITMRYYEGKTQVEISGELDISQAQVSRLEKNAISKLREEM